MNPIINYIVYEYGVTAKLLKSQDGNLFFARVKTGRPGTWSLAE